MVLSLFPLLPLRIACQANGTALPAARCADSVISSPAYRNLIEIDMNSTHYTVSDDDDGKL